MLDCNQITAQVEEYLQYMQGIGYSLEATSVTLRSFARFTRENNYDHPLTWKIVRSYCERGGADVPMKTKGRRFEAIAPFGHYASMFFPGSEQLPLLPYGRCHQRPRPHIYSDEEIVMLMEKSRTVYSPDGLRSLTLETVIGFMAVTGARTSEVVNLKLADVDFIDKLVLIRMGKNGKDRLLPLKDSVADTLRRYQKAIDEKISARRSPDSSFFVTTGGKPIGTRGIEYAFSRIRDCVDVSDSDYNVPILYHLRHTFACRTVRNWILDGQDVNKTLYTLTTYLGHCHPEDTYWYLSATPELMKLASSRYEEVFGGYEND